MSKKIKWTLIGFGIFVLVLVITVISVFIYIFITTGINFFSNQFTPDTKTPTKIDGSEKISDNEEIKDTDQDLVIDDLAYIKIMCMPYTDDADPEAEGISIYIRFYNTKSENVLFYDIPIDINIKLYATRFNWDTGEYETVEPPVYEGMVKVDHSMRLSEMFGDYIRIPFENIGPLPDEESAMGIAMVTVITQLQGRFEAKEEWVLLESQ